MVLALTWRESCIDADVRHQRDTEPCLTSFNVPSPSLSEATETHSGACCWAAALLIKESLGSVGFGSVGQRQRHLVGQTITCPY